MEADHVLVRGRVLLEQSSSHALHVLHQSRILLALERVDVPHVPDRDDK